MPQMTIPAIASMADRIKQNVGKVIVGHGDAVEKLLTAMLCGGHVLLEDVPGTGKTTMARAMAASVSGGFNRIQFTPDLLPSDILGTRVYSQKTGEFHFWQGPVFTNVLLADEINRATPRTQSALLECMEEKQVSEGGTTYRLEEPFLVIATQNPIETQGTFPLPEAQLDRFLMRLSLGYPTGEEALAMMARFDGKNPLAELTAVATCEELQQAHLAYTACEVSDSVKRYMIAITEKLRDPDHVRMGPSPRALLMLMRACQALACIRGRGYVIPDDVKELAEPVLAHRLVLRGLYTGNAAELVRDVLKNVPVPTEERV